VDDGLPANYQTEGRVYAAHVLKNHPNAKIGILYQNDDYGKDYLKGFEDGLARQQEDDRAPAELRGHRSTIDSQIVNLKNSGATVFFNITIPKFASRHQEDVRHRWKPTHYLNNVSSSLATVLKPAGSRRRRISSPRST